MPGARLVALVRNPVDRALSHYNHEVALGREPLSFEDALAAEDERLHGEDRALRADPRYFSSEWWSHTYKARGSYAEQLERWLEVFPREQLLIIPSEELARRAGARRTRRCSSSSARLRTSSSRTRASTSGEYEGMKPETRRRLAD